MFFVIHWQPKGFFEKNLHFVMWKCLCGIRISNKLLNTRDNIKEQFLVVHRIKYLRVFLKKLVFYKKECNKRNAIYCEIILKGC